MNRFIIFLASQAFFLGFLQGQIPDSISVKIGSKIDSIRSNGYSEAIDFHGNEGNLEEISYYDSLAQKAGLGKWSCNCKSEFIYQLSDLNYFDKVIDESLNSIELFNEECPEKTHKLYRYAGNAHYYLKNYDAAIRSWRVSIEHLIPYRLNEKIADTYMNIGSAYSNLGEFELAMENHNRALEFYEAEGLRESQAICWINLANTLAGMSREDSTLTYTMIPKIIEKYQEAEKIFIELKDTQNLAVIYANIGSQYETKEDYKTSNKYLKKSLDYLESVDDVPTLLHILIWKARNHAMLGEYKDAYDETERYIILNDSIINEEKVKAVSEMEAKYQNEKLSKENEISRLNQEQAEKEKLLAERDERIARQDSQSKSMYLYGAFGGLILLIGLAYTFFAGKRKQERINNELSKANKLIEHQRDEIEEKNQDIEDSINYAKSLQDAILPDIKTIQVGFPKAFIYFAPRDIVSGDFYWYSENEQYVFMAVADCTGHGVPGAFVSMTCSNVLDNVVNEKGISSPSEILKESHLGIVKSFRRKGSVNQANDGMDVIIVRWDKQKNELCYAGAMNPLYLVRDGLPTEFKANRRGLGGIASPDFVFEEEKIPLQKGDCFYLSTDGFHDQFGGEKGKKYKKKRFKDYLMKVSELPLDKRSAALENELLSWRGNYEQLDDILVIGFEV